MFTDEVIDAIAAAARDAKIEPAALLAIAEVESAGKAFAMVEGRREPVIRFEGHYFDRRLSGEKRDRARAAGLASPKAGAVANPRTQPARWALLGRAIAIDRKAALESVSWGLGQVMGAHWAWLGYASVDAMVEQARASVEGQALLMARYIAKAGLLTAIGRRGWAAFAKGYNGPLYRKHGYDVKIAAAFEKYRKAGDRTCGEALPATPLAGPVLRRGDRGEAVRQLQRLLSDNGYPLAADGAFGPATENAVRKFQEAKGLAADGIAGPKTLAALRSPAAAEAATPRAGWRDFLAALSRWFGGD